MGTIQTRNTRIVIVSAMTRVPFTHNEFKGRNSQLPTRTLPPKLGAAWSAGGTVARRATPNFWYRFCQVRAVGDRQLNAPSAGRPCWRLALSEPTF